MKRAVDYTEKDFWQCLEDQSIDLECEKGYPINDCLSLFHKNHKNEECSYKDFCKFVLLFISIGDIFYELGYEAGYEDERADHCAEKFAKKYQ